MAMCIIQLHHNKQAGENSALPTLEIYLIATYQSEEGRRGALTFQTLPRHQLQWFCFQLLYQWFHCIQTKQTYFCYPPWPSHELTFQPPNEKQHMKKAQHGKTTEYHRVREILRKKELGFTYAKNIIDLSSSALLIVVKFHCNFYSFRICMCYLLTRYNLLYSNSERIFSFRKQLDFHTHQCLLKFLQ